MAVGSRTAKLLIEAMAKHLPPSASTLRLLDVGGAAGEVLKHVRADLEVVAVSDDPGQWPDGLVQFDAVVAYNRAHDPAFLAAVLNALRPGGRYIMVSLDEETAGAEQVTTLEQNGYTRILVEQGIECPLPIGTLVRGEKPHTTADTLQRVQVASALDADRLDWDTYNGRFVYLLIRQTPHKPAWNLTDADRLEWRAAAVEVEGGTLALAFSSLPKAVAFMQPAVLDGTVTDVNKVAKFSRETAQGWSFPLAINPTTETITGGAVVWLPVDPAAAEAPDE
ncbi:MAG: hypothetical protein SF162_18085 [bacterium]|nr:hypothetical protein [bacterium]